MQTMNISLPDQLKEFVDTQVGSGRYSSVSEYVRELIRDDEKRKAQNRIEALLLEGLQSGEATEMTPRTGPISEQRPSGNSKRAKPESRSSRVATLRKQASAKRDRIEHSAWAAEHADIKTAD